MWLFITLTISDLEGRRVDRPHLLEISALLILLLYIGFLYADYVKKKPVKKNNNIIVKTVFFNNR